MREIKFRIWDGENSVMVRDAGVTPDGVAYSLPDDTGEFDSFDYFPDGEPMQFTGLKDKNGVDIYHHDLVLHGSKLCEVVWVQSMSSWKLRNRDKALDADDDWLSKSYTLEVIGNIYENSELLK